MAVKTLATLLLLLYSASTALSQIPAPSALSASKQERLPSSVYVCYLPFDVKFGHTTIPKQLLDGLNEAIRGGIENSQAGERTILLLTSGVDINRLYGLLQGKGEIGKISTARLLVEAPDGTHRYYVDVYGEVADDDHECRYRLSAKSFKALKDCLNEVFAEHPLTGPQGKLTPEKKSK